MGNDYTLKGRKGDKLFVFFNSAFLIIFFIIIVYPLVYVLSASISDPLLVSSGEMWLFPRGITFEGYKRVFNNGDIWMGYLNTIIYTLTGTFISLAATIPSSYALSRKDLKGRNIIMALFLFTMFFSGGLVPLYLVVKKLNMLNTVWSVLLPTACSVWNIVITRTFFISTIPKGLEEAAQIDGCNNFKLFFKIIIPLSMPIVAVMALFYAVGRWNSYFNEIIFLKDRYLFPLQVFLREILIINQMNDSNMITSISAESLAEQARISEIVYYSVMIVATLPILCVYPFLQKYFVKGVMIGSLKG